VSEVVYYAIGDVHGEAKRLQTLHEAIMEDIAAHATPATIVHLGDLIDRGPNSREVVEMIVRLHAAAEELDTIKVVTLRGNHEQMLLDAIDDPDPATFHHWTRNGGEAALASYEAHNGMFPDDWRKAIDEEHVAFLAAAPTMAYDEDRKIAFVHAGIDPSVFPACPDSIRLWTRSARFFRSEAWPKREELEDLLVVHGHTPTRSFEPDVSPRRINVDTGAVFGGTLTAVVLAPGQGPRFLKA
jgi:serine/threonine protein phosphatase 1